MSSLRVAAVQTSPTDDRAANLETAETLMEKAVVMGAQIISLAENFSYAGDEKGKLAVAGDVKTDPAVKMLKNFAIKHKVAIVGGSIPFRTNLKHKVSNSCLAIDNKGNIIARYDKIHLFDVELDENYTWKEPMTVKAGDKVVIATLFGEKIGLTICYDLRFPELFRALALKGAKIIFVPSAFTLYTGKDHWEPLLRARAIENQCYIVAPALIGHYSKSIETYGRSMIVDPWGQVLSTCQDKEDVIVSEIDMDYLDDIRGRLPSLNNIKRKTFFSSKAYKK